MNEDNKQEEKPEIKSDIFCMMGVRNWELKTPSEIVYTGYAVCAMHKCSLCGKEKSL